LKELKPLLEICNSLVTNKIILDKNRKVIFSDIATDINLDRYSDQDLGFSFSELKNIDKKFIIGHMLRMKSSDKQYFFIASAFRDKDNNFKGAIILQLNTDYLNTILVPQTNRTLLMHDDVEKSALKMHGIYEEMKKAPKIIFFKYVILRNTGIAITNYSKKLNKYLEFKYNPIVLKSLFYKAVINFIIISAILLVIVFLFFYKYALLPIKDSLNILQKDQVYKNEKVGIYNIFSYFNKYNLNQSNIISKQELEHREQFAKIISIIISIGSLSHYIKNKIEVLKEDIVDIIASKGDKVSSSSSFKKRLKNIKKTFENSEADIKSLTSEFTKFTQLIKTQNKENINISASLIEESVISRLKEQDYKDNVKIEGIDKFDIHVYKSFFQILLDEVLNLNNENLLLNLITIKNNNIQFVFKKRVINFINFQNEQFTLGKMIGMFNDINVSLLQDKKILLLN